MILIYRFFINLIFILSPLIILIRLLKIVFTSLLMGIFFKYLTLIFENQLVYDYHLKSLYLILSVLLGLIFYLLISFFIKAFNYKDLHLKY